MNKRINYAFLAFLAWMAALMCVTILSSCGSATRPTRAYGPDLMPFYQAQNKPPCAAYN